MHRQRWIFHFATAFLQFGSFYSIYLFILCHARLPTSLSLSHSEFLFSLAYIWNLRAFRLLMFICLLLFPLFCHCYQLCFYYVVACKCHFFRSPELVPVSFCYFFLLVLLFQFGFFFSRCIHFESYLIFRLLIRMRKKAFESLFLSSSCVVWFHSLYLKYQFRFTIVEICAQ